MKLGLKILFLLTLVSFVYAEGTVTLEQSIDIALNNSPALKVYREQVVQAKTTEKLAKASFYPTVTGAANYTRRGPKVETGDTVISPSETSDGGITVGMPLYFDGTVKIVTDGARSLTKSAEYDLYTSVYNIINNVKTNYLMCLLYKENIETAESGLKLSKDYLEKVKQEVSVGTKAKFDITRQEYDVAARENALVDAQNNYNQMVNNFNLVLGKENDFVLPAMTDNLFVANVGNMDGDLISVANENRTDLKKAVQDFETAKLYLLNEKKANNPKITVGGNYNHLFVNQTGAKRDTWAVQTSLSVPIFDGGINRQNVKINESKVEMAQKQIDATKQSIVTGVLNAKLGINSAKAQIAACEKALKLAEEAYDIAKLRYEQNLGTYLDVSDALDQLINSKNGLTGAKYSYAVNMCNLEKELATTEKVDDYVNAIIGEIK